MSDCEHGEEIRVWWCETHKAEGVPLPWGWEADECWRSIFDEDVDSDALCSMVRRRLLTEAGT